MSGSIVDEDKEERYDQSYNISAHTQTSKNYPLNYGTCMTFLSSLNSCFKVTSMSISFHLLLSFLLIA